MTDPAVNAPSEDLDARPSDQQDGGSENPFRAAVRIAKEAADEAPPALREETYRTILALQLEMLKSTTAAVSERGRQAPKAAKTPSTRPRGRPAGADEEEIQRVLSAAPELWEKYAYVPNLMDSKSKIYAVIRFARELGVDPVSKAEVEAILNSTRGFRLGLPSGTITSVLSQAPRPELEKVPGEGRTLKYSIMRGGEGVLEMAIRRAKEPQTTLSSGPS